MKNKNQEKEVHLLIHRAVAEAFVENPNKHLYVKHKDGDPSNNHANNLEWVAEGGDQEIFDNQRYQGISDPHELTMAYIAEE